MLDFHSLFASQCARYALLEPQDLLKALYQSVFGCGHFVADEQTCLDRIRAEFAGSPILPPVEALTGEYCRLQVSVLKTTALTAETLARLFRLSAEPAGTPEALEALEAGLAVLLSMADDGELPVSAPAVRQAVTAWSQAGYPACHHSEVFRQSYHPAYRVVKRTYGWMLPLLAAIDEQLSHKQQVTVAIEGGSASGKTTLAAELQRIYDDSCVFHMDDFFLRPVQRTPERYAEPGGNVDRERFAAEVLEPLKRGETVQYRRFDCGSFTLLPPVELCPARLNIVEGAYSVHPDLADAYDLSVFLQISPESQRCRLTRRNTPEQQERFLNTWIPMEQRYFEAMEPRKRCTLTLEVEA